MRRPFTRTRPVQGTATPEYCNCGKSVSAPMNFCPVCGRANVYGDSIEIIEQRFGRGFSRFGVVRVGACRVRLTEATDGGFRPYRWDGFHVARPP